MTMGFTPALSVARRDPANLTHVPDKDGHRPPRTIAWAGDNQHTYRVYAPSEPSLEEALFDQRVALKLVGADFSAHLDQVWRAGLFRQLDNLLDAEEWDLSDKMPSPESFRTFLRMIVHNKPARRPGLAATSDGKIIATWTEGRDRLTIECLPDDTLRWVLTKYVDGERLSSANTAPVRRLREILAPFHPESWFGNQAA